MMNKCVICGKEYESKRVTSKYCSGKCRKLAFQRNGKVSVPASSELSVPAYTLVPDVKVYGRQAVRYDSLRERRPEPLSPDDTPKLLNRGKYTRPDGSEYIFDAIGQVFVSLKG